MITNPEDSIKLTDEQSKQLETFQTRLVNLQNEILIATKSLSVIRNDTVRAAEESDYQKKTLKGLLDEIDTAKKTLENFSEEIKTASALLLEKTTRAEQVGIANDKKSEELKQREEILTLREAKYTEDIKSHAVETEKLAGDKKLVYEAKETLSEALKKIIW